MEFNIGSICNLHENIWRRKKILIVINERISFEVSCITHATYSSQIYIINVI